MGMKTTTDFRPLSDHVSANIELVGGLYCLEVVTWGEMRYDGRFDTLDQAVSAAEYVAGRLDWRGRKVAVHIGFLQADGELRPIKRIDVPWTPR